MAISAPSPLRSAASVSKVAIARTRQRGSGYYWAIRALSVIVVLGGWEVLGGQINPVFLSTPSRIVVALVTLIRNGQLFAAQPAGHRARF
jgi:ABC-type nitrate/sulfonate/bicarbonate transport system permease component